MRSDHVEGDGYARARGHGSGKRGAPSIDSQDGFERKILEQAEAAFVTAAKGYRGGVALLTSEAVKSMGDADRIATRRATLDHLARLRDEASLLERTADEILERHRHEQRRDKADAARADARRRVSDRRLANLEKHAAREK